MVHVEVTRDTLTEQKWNTISAKGRQRNELACQKKEKTKKKQQQQKANMIRY
jgi:hypothetical protein